MLWFLITVYGSAQISPSVSEQKIDHFEVNGLPLIDAVFQFARENKFPLGFEYLSHNAITRPISLELNHTTVATALDRLIGTIPGYLWYANKGVVVITNVNAPHEKENLLDTTLPVFKISRIPATNADVGLYVSLYSVLFPGERYCWRSSRLDC